MNPLKKLYKIGKMKHSQRIVEYERKHHQLKYIFWEATLKCCLICKHCGVSAGRTSNVELEKNTVQKIFKQIAGQMDSSKITVGVTGGEPLLRQDIFEITQYISDLGFHWGMVTNGFFVDDESIKKMKKTSMETIAVSLDGLKTTHNWIRNNNKAFDVAIEAVRKLQLSNFLDKLEIITTITHKSVGELQGLYDLVKKLKINQWRIAPVVITGRANLYEKQISLQPKDMIKILEFLKRVRKEKKLDITLSEGWFCGPEYEFDVRDWGFMCPAGINSLAIMSNGDIKGCPLINGMVEGNIKNGQDIVNIWEKKFLRYRDISWKKTGICKNCEWFDFCLGESLHLWKKPYKGPIICSYKLIKEAKYDRSNC